MIYEPYKAVKNTKFVSKNIKYGILKLLLEKIYLCYEQMVLENFNLPNDEESIRNVLLYKYMKNQQIKQPVCSIYNFRFEGEVSESHTIQKEGKEVRGRTDIKVLPTSGIDSDNDEAYYIIECKRLDHKALQGKSGLNAEYIKNGIVRFTTDQYKSYYRVNAMLAFIVSELDTDQNMFNINHVNQNFFSKISNTIQPIKPIDKNKLYHSIHTNHKKDTIDIFHLIMDFSLHMEEN